MEKAIILLIFVASLIGAGIALSFYGSYIITEDLTRNQAMIEKGQTLELQSDLDPNTSTIGVYVVQVMNFQKESIVANLYDPFDDLISSTTLSKESLEERFDIESSGIYRLIVENTGEGTDAISVLGHAPENIKYSISVAGFYLLIVGLLGIIGVGIYAVKKRKS